MSTTETHHYRMKLGRYKGERLTRVPQSYLRWIVKQGDSHAEHDLALAELNRRGCVLPCIDISAHAIDRASQRLLKHWRKMREGDEGLHAWLARISMDAIAHHGKREGQLTYRGIVFDVTPDGVWPTVRSVWRDKHAKGGAA